MLPRACGCVAEFQVYAVDKYRAERQAKFQSTRCPACVAKLVARQAAVPRKQEAFGLLPAGTQMTLTRLPDGTWAGGLAADGTEVRAAAISARRVLFQAPQRMATTPQSSPPATATRPINSLLLNLDRNSLMAPSAVCEP